MDHYIKSLTLLIISLIQVLPVFGRSPLSDANERKADYIFMEALSRKEAGEYDSYLELCEYASRLNPSDSFLGRECAMKKLFESRSDSVGVRKALEMYGRYVAGAPDDYYSNITYAGLLSRFGYVDESIEEWSKIYSRYSDRLEVPLTFAEVLISTGQHPRLLEAMAIYDTLEVRNGVDVDLAGRKMQLYNLLGDTVSVKAEVRKLVAMNPMSVEYNTFAGSVYMQMGERDSALRYFDRALDIDPTNGAASFYRASYFNHIGDSIAYDREVFNALTKSDLDVEPKIAILRDYVVALYADTLQHARINDMFKALTDQYPHEAQVRDLYAAYLITVKDYPMAIEQIEYQLAADPSDQSKWGDLGSLQFMVEKYDEAAGTALKALHYFPNEVRFIGLYGTARMQQGAYRDAIDFIDRYVAEITDTLALSDLWSQKGDIFYKWERTDSAFACYEKALNYNPENLLALNNCAYYMACENIDLPRALSMIETVVEANPDASTSLDTYAWVLFKLKQYAKAREVIDGAMKNDVEVSAELLDHAGDIYFMNGLSDEALDFWTKALELDASNELIQWKVKNKTIKLK